MLQQIWLHGRAHHHSSSTELHSLRDCTWGQQAVGSVKGLSRACPSHREKCIAEEQRHLQIWSLLCTSTYVQRREMAKEQGMKAAPDTYLC